MPVNNIEFITFVIQNRIMSKFYKLNIKKIIKETPKAVSIIFDIPSNIKQEFIFIAGQYVTIKAIINDEEVRRAYSLCSSPKSNEIKVAVKAVENGKFSTFATTQLKDNDVLEVSKPEGRFLLKPKPNKNYIGFAAGSGVTPVLSMIKSVLESEKTSSFTLIYGNKTVSDTIFYNELNELEKQYPKQFALHYVFSRERQKEALFGRINREQVNYFIRNIYKKTNFDEAFLCGPEQMINIVLGSLIENKISSDNIHYELFTVTENKQAALEIKNGKTEITIILDDEETSFTMKQSDTVLAAALRNKLDAPFSCQGGVCSSCLALITEGEAVMTKNEILTDEELKEGLTLTCQAHPTTDKIIVDFDSV